jgi:cellulose synthase/poly-beta-1,6-N-acetylglucosamine synthase-like glycosyltransferase
MFLPSPPSNKEKILYVGRGRHELYLLSLFSTVLLSIGMVLFILTNPLFIPYTVFSIATLIYLFFTYLIGFLGKDFNYGIHNKLLTEYIDRSAVQEIDIFLPVCGESLSILRNTWTYVNKLREAQEGITKVYVLDDSSNKKVKELAISFDFEYIDRPIKNLKKAGNLRYAFNKTKAPYFLVLDADFCPRTDLIINMMPYFYEDSSIGIVQSPQFFSQSCKNSKDLTIVQRSAGAVQELFYRLIQVNRDSFKGSICVGSCAIYSRKHLEQFGGTADIGYSEDVRTSFRLTAFGNGIVKYIPLNLAAGTCPENYKQAFTQFYRWSMGSLDLMLSKEFWQKGLTVMQRICYMSGMLYYFTTGLSVIFYFLPSVFMLIFKPTYIHWFNLLFSVPSILLSTVYMKHWNKLPYDLNVLRLRQVSFYAHLFAIKDLFLNTMEPWQPTGTNVKSDRYNSFKILFIFMTFFIPILTFSLIIYRVFTGYDIYNFILLILLTSFNFYISKPIIKSL